jgi:hypothetical protein
LTALVSLSVVSAESQTSATLPRASASSKASTSATGTVPRPPDRHPNLQGTWNRATLTPMERPAAFAGRVTVSEAEAKDFARKNISDNGMDGAVAGTGPYNRVISYNDFWIDRGTMLTRINGEYRTSLIVDPPDGKMPPLTAAAKERLATQGHGPGSADVGCAPGMSCADNPEDRPLSERCLLGVGTPAGPPSLSGAYNNITQIVHTEDFVMLLTEMNHDARIIPFNRPHLPSDIKQWMGDSVARWEGDTLVIETTNMRDDVRLLAQGGLSFLRRASEALRVTERLRRVGADTLVYRFTIEDANTWTRPWTGETAWVKTDEPLLEYACHEGNYALGDIMRGARTLEKEAAARAKTK